MNKTTVEIAKSLKKLNAETVATYKQFFKDLKKKNVTVLRVFGIDDWNKPAGIDFKMYADDADAYIEGRGVVDYSKELHEDDLCDVIEFLRSYTFVAKDELEKFKTATYPKLYAKWKAEQKKICADKKAAAAKNPDKIRAKIAKLQQRLEELES